MVFGLSERLTAMWTAKDTPSGAVGPAHVTQPISQPPPVPEFSAAPGPPQPGYPYRASNGELICCEDFHGYTVKVQNSSVNIYDGSGKLWVPYPQSEIMDRIGTWRRIKNGADEKLETNRNSLPRTLPLEVVKAIQFALTPKMQSGQSPF